MNRDKNILNRISSIADLQDEPLPGMPLIELVGDCRVLIERHMGITEYTAERIVVKVNIGRFSIDGTDLEVVTMTKNQLIIKGTIFNINIIKE